MLVEIESFRISTHVVDPLISVLIRKDVESSSEPDKCRYDAQHQYQYIHGDAPW